MKRKAPILLLAAAALVTTVELMEAARRAGIAVTSLSVQSTTLDDVFVHYTGHQLRDELQAPRAAESAFILKR